MKKIVISLTLAMLLSVPICYQAAASQDGTEASTTHGTEATTMATTVATTVGTEATAKPTEEQVTPLPFDLQKVGIFIEEISDNATIERWNNGELYDWARQVNISLLSWYQIAQYYLDTSGLGQGYQFAGNYCNTVKHSTIEAPEIDYTQTPPVIVFKKYHALTLTIEKNYQRVEITHHVWDTGNESVYKTEGTYPRNQILDNEDANKLYQEPYAQNLLTEFTSVKPVYTFSALAGQNVFRYWSVDLYYSNQDTSATTGGTASEGDAAIASRDTPLLPATGGVNNMAFICSSIALIVLGLFFNKRG